MDPIQTTSCTGECTVTLVVESAPITVENADDLMGMWWGFMAALAAVWGLKRIYALFNSDNG